MKIFFTILVLAVASLGAYLWQHSADNKPLHVHAPVTTTVSTPAPPAKEQAAPVAPVQQAPQVAIPAPAAQTTTSSPASPPAQVAEPAVINQPPPVRETVPTASKAPKDIIFKKVKFKPGPSIFDGEPSEEATDDTAGTDDEDSIFDAPPQEEPERESRRRTHDEDEYAEERPRRSRFRTLSRAEVDAEVGYVPEPEPEFAPQQPEFEPQSIPYRRQSVRRAPPRERFSDRRQFDRRRGHAHGPRRCRQHPRGCPRQCPRQQYGLGYRVVQPAFAVQFAFPSRPAHSGYGPAHGPR